MIVSDFESEPLIRTDFGIGAHVCQCYWEYFAKFPTVDKVLIYGSRAKGNYESGSDIDFAVDAPNLTRQDWVNLHLGIEELPVVFTTDCVWLQDISDEKFREKILRDGKVFYSSSSI